MVFKYILLISYEYTLDEFEYSITLYDKHLSGGMGIATIHKKFPYFYLTFHLFLYTGP